MKTHRPDLCPGSRRRTHWCSGITGAFKGRQTRADILATTNTFTAALRFSVIVIVSSPESNFWNTDSGQPPGFESVWNERYRNLLSQLAKQHASALEMDGQHEAAVELLRKLAP